MNQNSQLIKLTPVGGCGQIGSNMTLVQVKDELIAIDCGILFPYDDSCGVDFLIPNLDSIPDLDKIFITHAHEDHIGAIYYLVRKFPNIKIWATKFAKKLINNKFEYNNTKPPNIIEYKENERIEFSNFSIRSIPVNHSIPETMGALIQDKHLHHSIFFASDFKINRNSPYEEVMDLTFLKAEMNKSKNKTILADSTNIYVNERSYDEDQVIEEFKKVFSTSKRVLVTLFSSNIHRIQSIINVAKLNNRVVLAHGRSIRSYCEAALKTNNLKDAGNVLYIDPTSEQYNDPSAIILLTGCQGDFRGSFRRVLIGEDKKVKLSSDDTILLSSKAIPGNEKKISYIIGKGMKYTKNIFTDKDLKIHVSGHACKKDLKELYDIINPNWVIPIHGEMSFLREHKNFILKTFKNINPIMINNNDSLFFNKDGTVTVEKGDEIDPLLISAGELIEKEVISKRRKISENGILFLSFHKLKLDSIKIESFGIHSIVKENDIKDMLNNSLGKIDKNIGIEESLRINLRREFSNRYNFKPIVIVHNP